jgi:hypothetical protein
MLVINLYKPYRTSAQDTKWVRKTDHWIGPPEIVDIGGTELCREV